MLYQILESRAIDDVAMSSRGFTYLTDRSNVARAFLRVCAHFGPHATGSELASNIA